MRQLLCSLYSRYKEAILYLVFGVATTIVNWGVYALLVKYAHSSVFIGNCTSWVAATLFAFVTNKFWVFESYEIHAQVIVKELFLFVSTRLGTGAFEVIAVPLLISLGLNQALFGVEGFLSKIVVSVLVVLLNYIFSKLVIFKKSPEDAEKA